MHVASILNFICTTYMTFMMIFKKECNMVFQLTSTLASLAAKSSVCTNLHWVGFLTQVGCPQNSPPSPSLSLSLK